MSPQITPVPAETRQLIESRLASIASEQNIKILYACESGSRAWGFPSPNSDYDVRFIYVHSLDWYLKLDEDRDVIDLPLEHSSAGILDLGGWDLRKTLRLLGKSNPVIWEWLQSPICYHDEKLLRESREVFDPFYSPIAACHHYLSICRNTMSQGLNESTVKIKKYFYMLRPLLAAVWIERYRSIPPMELEPLLAALDDRLDIKCSISELQERKQNTDEQVPIPRITMIDQFLESEVSRLQEPAKLLPTGGGDKDKLDAFFCQSIIQ
ncbi:nucleotidyltransferase domain-containing protein [Methylomonas sp. ZR1]|uniref:nucleotidyltransferase domain-containing protein n=1 Tax=Methylomonas sp. ZR1 TaxID=1797072 RepID=UPI001490F8BE|nr:nucleotidyltransferase domain-containing protein [Methylomonas sp. ZR1]NOV29232.1 nucleotidyltransferase domain-containing protein [Methylomonas sp. ZR1]